MTFLVSYSLIKPDRILGFVSSLATLLLLPSHTTKYPWEEGASRVKDGEKFARSKDLGRHRIEVAFF